MHFRHILLLERWQCRIGTMNNTLLVKLFHHMEKLSFVCLKNLLSFQPSTSDRYKTFSNIAFQSISKQREVLVVQ